MFNRAARQQKQLDAARTLFEHLAKKLDARISIKLWDGTIVPLGENADPDLCVSLSGPGVISSLIRRPTPDNLLRHYARGNIDFGGTDIYSLLEIARVRNSRKRAKSIKKSVLAKSLLPFVFGPAASTNVDHCYSGDETGLQREQTENKDFIQFHYDLSNDFYKLFLDPEMVYSCAYFTDWNNSLEQAQQDKLDMICRKLRLQPGERFLDIGCGWGALIIHAARNYGVKSHGITLSQQQHDYAKEKIKRLGLQDQVTVEIRDYADLD